MKTMKIEKQLLFAEQVKKLINLQVKDGLQYQHDMDGIRAIGPLYINGQFETSQGAIQEFQEVLDMDILAPNHKLSGDTFSIQVENFEGTPENDSLNLMVTMSIHGLQDAKEESVTSLPEQIVDEVMVPIHQEQAETIEKVNAKIEESVASNEAFEEFEDLFEDADTTYVSYRMIVAKPNDTYESIAQRYDTQADTLRERNHHKELIAKTLVILP